MIPQVQTASRRCVSLLCLLFMVSIAAMGLWCQAAVAGSWIAVSCQNPDGSNAPSESWSAGSGGGVGYGSNNSTGCSANGPMVAELGAGGGSEPVNSSETLEYSPPSGSTLIGGQVSVGLYAPGYGENASAVAAAYSPNFSYDGSNVMFQCTSYAPANQCGSGPEFTGTLNLPSGKGGHLYVAATCGGIAGQWCSSGAKQINAFNTFSLVYVHWARLLLSNSANPAASGFGGGLLQPNASGQTEVTFSATDSGGPGVYTVTVQIDGNTVYNATPDNNGGHCASVGASAGVLMFDYAQPCKQSETVSVPVDTRSLGDGTHSLKVIVTDAAQNSSTVYNASISTDNQPRVIATPIVNGVAQVGSTLTAVPAVFEALAGLSPLSAVTGQWLRCSGAGTGCSAIAGASATTYTPVAADKGYTIEYESFVEDVHRHRANSTSAPTLAVTEAPNSGGSCTSAGGCQQNPGSTNTTNNNSTNSTSSNSSTNLSNEALTLARGAANGSPASDQANLEVRWSVGAYASSIRAKYTAKSRAEGRLFAGNGQPIAGATVVVMATPSSPGHASFQEGTVRTSRDGRFTFNTRPRRSSRTLSFQYRSHANDLSLAAQTQLSVGVPVPVSLKIHPRVVKRGSRIRMTGSVPTPIPSGGKQIVLQAFAVGVHKARWQTFNVVRTAHGGRFKATYRFRFAGPATYRIRALSRYEQDYPYLASTSAPILIREH